MSKTKENERKVSRRKFIYAGAGVVVVAAAGAAYYLSQPSPALPTPTLTATSTASTATSTASTATSTALQPYLQPDTWFSKGPPLYGGTFVGTWTSDVATFNPCISTDGNTILFGVLAFDKLMEIDMWGKIYPKLAKSWNSSSDGKRWTFDLVQGATFHDGQPITSEDVQYSLLLLGKYNGEAKPVLGSATVDAPDDHTVVVNLTDPSPFTERILAYKSHIVPKHILKSLDIKDLVAHPQVKGTEPVIGSGPFMWDERVTMDHVRLKRYPNYWIKELPYIDTVIWRIIPDAVTQVASLQKGDASYQAITVDPSSVAKLAQNPMFNVAVGSVMSERFIQVWPNNRHPILKNMQVRQAISSAIDREYILKAANYGLGDPTNQPAGRTGAASWAWAPDAPSWKQDIDQANKLLDEAGYPKDSSGTRFEIKFNFRTGKADEPKAAEMVAEYLKNVGIKVNLIPTEGGAYTVLMTNWDFELGISSMGFMVDPQLNEQNYHSKYILHSPWLNDVGYSNPRVDQLYDLARTELDQNKRAAYFQEIHKIIATECPTVIIYQRYEVCLWNADFTMKKDTPCGLPNDPFRWFYSLHNAWWKKGSPQRS